MREVASAYQELVGDRKNNAIAMAGLPHSIYVTYLAAVAYVGATPPSHYTLYPGGGFTTQRIPTRRAIRTFLSNAREG